MSTGTECTKKPSKVQNQTATFNNEYATIMNHCHMRSQQDVIDGFWNTVDKVVEKVKKYNKKKQCELKEIRKKCVCASKMRKMSDLCLKEGKLTQTPAKPLCVGMGVQTSSLACSSSVGCNTINERDMNSLNRKAQEACINYQSKGVQMKEKFIHDEETFISPKTCHACEIRQSIKFVNSTTQCEPMSNYSEYPKISNSDPMNTDTAQIENAETYCLRKYLPSTTRSHSMPDYLSRPTQMPQSYMAPPRKTIEGRASNLRWRYAQPAGRVRATQQYFRGEPENRVLDGAYSQQDYHTTKNPYLNCTPEIEQKQFNYRSALNYYCSMANLRKNDSYYYSQENKSNIRMPQVPPPMYYP